MQILAPDSPLDTPELQGVDLAIAIGTEATRRLLMLEGAPPILSVFIPRRTFEALAADHRPAIDARRLGALFLEQPFSRQLDLLSLVKPQTRTLGALLGPSSAPEREPIEREARARHWRPRIGRLNENDNPLETLTPIIADSDAFLVVPDRAIFNRNTARWILLMTLRQRIPLIAYSKRYVEAGALAAVHSTAATTGEETAQLIRRWQTTETLPPPGYPRLFEISINRRTARTLRLELPDLSTLSEALQEMQAR